MRKVEKSAKRKFLQLIRESYGEARNWRKLLKLFEQCESRFEHFADHLPKPESVPMEDFTAAENDEVRTLLTDLTESRDQFMGAVLKACTNLNQITDRKRGISKE
jgi:phytoene dehydrogenase-like protein